MNIVHLQTLVSIIVIVVFLHVARRATTTRKVIGGSVVVPPLQRDAPRIKAFVLQGHNLLVVLFSNDNPSRTPGEVVLVPKRIDREDKRVDGKGQKINQHPADVLPLSFENKNDGLKAIDGCYHDNRNQRELSSMRCNAVDEIAQITTGSRQDDRSEEVDEDNKTHTEATEAAKVWQPHQFREVVDCGINPPTSLRQEHAPRLRRGGACVSVRYEFVRHLRKVFRHKCCKISILSKRKEILLVQGIHVTGVVVIDDFIGDDQWPSFIDGPKSIHTETGNLSAEITTKGRGGLPSRQTCDGTEQRLESLGQMM